MDKLVKWNDIGSAWVSEMDILGLVVLEIHQLIDQNLP